MWNGTKLHDDIWKSDHPFLYRRLGFIIDFLSHAVVIGFMAGAAITIGLQQLKSLLGYKDFTTHSDIISVLTSVGDYKSQVTSVGLKIKRERNELGTDLLALLDAVLGPILCHRHILPRLPRLPQDHGNILSCPKHDLWPQCTDSNICMT